MVGRICDHLGAHFGDRSIFRDCKDIQVGSNFIDEIELSLAQSDVLLAVIGPNWLGKREGARLEEPGDFVRREVEGALRRSMPIIPVLIGGADLPPAELLPASMAPMLDRQAIAVRSDPDFRSDVHRLIAEIERLQKRRELLTGGMTWAAKGKPPNSLEQ
jgi:hypothetical protein